MTDKLAQFRNIKVPLWARLLGAWRARQHRKVELNKTVYVATISAWVHYTDINSHGRGHYVLYRNGLGKRWLNTTATAAS